MKLDWSLNRQDTWTHKTTPFKSKTKNFFLRYNHHTEKKKFPATEWDEKRKKSEKREFVNF